MRTDIREDQDWKTLLSFLPEDLTGLARATGALRRMREVRSGEDLLRLNLAYSDESMSLRQVSAWSGATGLAEISDVGLLKRLRNSRGFLRRIVSSLLGRVHAPGLSMRVVLLDATSLSRQRSAGTDFRVHLSYDLTRASVCGVELTDASQGERITRAAAGKGDLLVVDRGYQGRQALSELTQTGAHALLRFHPSSFPLESPDGQALSVLDTVESLAIGQAFDMDVQTAPTKRAPATSGRLIALRKTEQQAQRDLQRLKKRAKEDKREIGQEALRASKFVFLFCTLSREQAGAELLLETYRLRWQVEMAFKGLKSIMSLGEIVAKDMELCEAKILSQLIVLLLIQEYDRAFFPWGYPLRRPQPLAVA